jgi:hypothetical protein
LYLKNRIIFFLFNFFISYCLLFFSFHFLHISLFRFLHKFAYSQNIQDGLEFQILDTIWLLDFPDLSRLIHTNTNKNITFELLKVCRQANPAWIELRVMYVRSTVTDRQPRWVIINQKPIKCETKRNQRKRNETKPTKAKRNRLIWRKWKEKNKRQSEIKK